MSMDSQRDAPQPQAPQPHEASRGAGTGGSTTSEKYKKPFFGVPIVGFFDQRNRKGKPKKNRLSDGCGNGEDQPLLPLEQQTTQKVPPYSVSFNFDDVNENGRTSTTETQKPCRSGKELWGILRYHILHESFHIRYQFADTVRRKQDKIQFTEDVNLPYDFSVTDCFVALCVYLVISIIAYSFVFENWTMIDSMYFAVVTFTTIGYGDLSPTTHGGRLFCSFFALAGVAVLAIGLGVVGSKIIESQVAQISKAEDKLANNVFHIFKPKPKTAKEKQAAYLQSSGSSGGSSSFAYLDEFDNPASSMHEDVEDTVHPWHAFTNGCRYFGRLLMQYFPSLFPLFLGAYFIGHYENWTWDDCIYYCVVTTTTIGFGDFTPHRQSLRAFAVLFIPLSVGAMGHFLGTIANFIVEQRSRVYDKQLWHHQITLEDLHSMSEGHGETVTELEFVLFMLKAMKKVDADLLDKIRAHFRRLDLTGSGTLVRADLELMAKRKLRGARSKLRLGTYKATLAHKGSASFHSFEELEEIRRSIDV